MKRIIVARPQVILPARLQRQRDEETAAATWRRKVHLFAAFLAAIISPAVALMEWAGFDGKHPAASGVIAYGIMMFLVIYLGVWSGCTIFFGQE